MGKETAPWFASLADFYRSVVLLLIESGAEMTEAADRIPQAAWDEAFECGLAEQRTPLHGEPYAQLTDAGRAQLDRFFEAANSQASTDGT